jgi:hypothetical protein
MNNADENSAIVPSALAASSAGAAQELPEVQRGATPCNTWKSAIPGVSPEALQHNELSPRQMAAVHLMLHGQSDLQVAQQLGVDRTTVFRWRTRMKAFAMELERQRQGMYHRSIDRLHAMLEPALKVLEDPKVATDPKMALRIVRLALSQKPDRKRRDVYRPDPIADATEAYVDILMRKEQQKRTSEQAALPKGGKS